MAGRTEALTREDKRYEEIFSVERETRPGRAFDVKSAVFRTA
jgi:hypothetical protein